MRQADRTSLEATMTAIAADEIWDKGFVKAVVMSPVGSMIFICTKNNGVVFVFDVALSRFSTESIRTDVEESPYKPSIRALASAIDSLLTTRLLDFDMAAKLCFREGQPDFMADLKRCVDYALEYARFITPPGETRARFSFYLAGLASGLDKNGLWHYLSFNKIRENADEQELVQHLNRCDTLYGA